MRQLFLIITLSLLTFVSSFAQNGDFKNRFEEANVLMEDHWYAIALPMWLDLLKQQPDNYNLNFKIGICFNHKPTEEIKGLPYLRKAIKGISKNYDPFTATETNSKPDALFYLAHLYHIEYELDSAILYFNKFIENVHKKHILVPEAKRRIQQCENAKEQLKHPLDVKIENLGLNINSEYSEHSPVLSLDETEIVFTSRRLREDSSNIKFKDMHDGMYFEDVYIAYKDQHGVWGKPELINIDRVNHHLASVGLSPDNQTLYVYHDEDGSGNLYQSDLISENKWSRPEQISAEIDNDDASENHLTISTDGNMLFFTSDRDGGLGGYDIYVCKKLPTGEWSKAQNIGAPINTPYDEASPFFHPDGITLHFSSKGHNSMGGYDIFYSEIKEDNTWSNPINIGYPINTTHNDVSYVTSPDGKRGYFASHGRKGGFGHKDIYIALQKDAIEKELTLLKGFINVTKGDTLPKNIIVNLTDNETGRLIAKSRPSMRNGSFVFIIPPGENYNISYEVDGNDFYNENIYVPMGSQYQEINKEILLDPVALTAKVVNQETGRKWTVKFQTLGTDTPQNLSLKCVDDAGNILFVANKDTDGSFSFKDLPTDNYLLMLYNEDGSIVDCSTIKIALFNDNNKKTDLHPNNNCGFSSNETEKSITAPKTTEVKAGKIGKITFVNLNEIPKNSKIQYLDNKDEIYFTEKVDEKGYFNYRELEQNKTTKLNLISSVPCSGAQIKIIDASNESIVFTEFKAVNEGACYFIPVVIEKLSFQEFFTYNKNVPAREKELQNFIDKLVAQVQSIGSAKISIESSASRVPTKTYGSNEKLSKLRAEKAKKMLLEKLSAKGITESKITFINVTTLVQGPRYKGDYLKNKTTYEKYQYVKIYSE